MSLPASVKYKVQDVSELCAAVDKIAKRKRKWLEDEMAVHYSAISNKEAPNKSEVQEVSDMYAAVDKSAKTKLEESHHFMPLLMKKTISMKSSEQNLSISYQYDNKHHYPLDYVKTYSSH